MLTNDYPPICGGGGYHTHYLAKKLAERGHKITIITRGSAPTTHVEQVGNIEIFHAGFLMAPPFQAQVFAYSANKIFKNIEPYIDVVVLNGPIIPTLKSKLPTIVIEHVTARRFIDNLERGSIFSAIFKTFSPFYIKVDKDTLKRANKIITPSTACAQDINNYYFSSDIEVIPNGVDTSFFIPNHKTKPGKRVVFVGIFGPIKGLTDLIQSALYVKQYHHDVKYVLIGSGPLEKHIKRTIQRLGLEDNFEFTGYLRRQDLLEQYQKAAICVLPSWYEGGMSTTLLEAMACGIPVVATAVGGSTEIVHENDNGLLVPPKNPAMLGQAIKRILDDKLLGTNMGIQGRKLTVENHDWDIVANKFETTFASVLRNYTGAYDS